jgi:serine protease Do
MVRRAPSVAANASSTDHPNLETAMSGNFSPRSRGALSARRFALLATTIAGLSAAAFVIAPSFVPKADLFAAHAQNLTQQAQQVARPVGFADIVEKVKPAVVSVRVKMEGSAENSGLSGQDLPFPPGSPFEQFFRRFGSPGNGSGVPHRHNTITGQGSGFFISADGYVVTNNHVVDKAENVQVTTDDGKTYTAKVIGTDSRSDLALIKIDGRSDFPYVKLSDNAPRIGDWVLAVGNPFGLGGTVTAGIVSARGRDIGAGPYDDFIQIDAPVNKGNSGGPSFDMDGSVIGVNTAIFTPSGGSVGIAFDIPADTVKSVVAQLKDKGSVTRGWIGVQIQPVTKDIADSMGLKNAAGALVAEPQKDSPASKAGIESGDVIVSVNDKTVRDARELARMISGMPPNTTVKLGMIHQGQEKTVTLTLGELPNQRQASADSPDREQTGTEVPKIGLTLAPAGKVAGSGDNGVVVTSVQPGSVAADHGFQTGDVILDVGGKSVSSPTDVRKHLGEARKEGKHTVLFRVKSGQGTKFVALPLGNA